MFHLGADAVHDPFKSSPPATRTVRPMDPMLHSNPAGAVSVVQGYPSDALAEFVRTVDERAAALRLEIEDARSRQSRARAALGTHRQMHAMLTEAQREIAHRRHEAADQIAGFQRASADRIFEPHDARVRPRRSERPRTVDGVDTEAGLQWTS